jgi:hypothetical protein
LFAAASFFGFIFLAPVATQVALADPDSADGSTDVNESLPYSIADRGPQAGMLKLVKSGLGQAQLLRASLIEQVPVATGNGALTRIVRFERRGDKVFMLEDTKGHNVTRDLGAHLILAEFPIVHETRQNVWVDFNAGMRRVFLAANWHASDMGGAGYDFINRAFGAEVSNAFLSDHAEYLDGRPGGGKLLSINQVVQLRYMDGFYHPTYEVRYYLSPYRPVSDFVIRENPVSMRKYGYFETAPILEEVTGRSTVPITRWNLDAGPVVYHISANTPPEYMDAVREGILYWNKAFGREVLKVEITPEGITAPNPFHNIVQWVPYDGAGFAYADALPDPHTGEIMNAQIYLTSVFAFRTKERVRELIRTLEALGESDHDHGHDHDHGDDDDHDADEGDEDSAVARLRQAISQSGAVGAQAQSRLVTSLRDLTDLRSQFSLEGRGQRPALLGAKHLCSLNMRKQMIAAMEAALQDESLDNEALLRLSQDMIRSVVAHEVGHTMGLRHNFAGKLVSQLTIEQKEQLFQQYVDGGPEAVAEALTQTMFTSSVMDYPEFKDDVLLGVQIRDLPHAMPYDTFAIHEGYGLELAGKIPPAKQPPFCTDSGVGVFGDCVPFATSSSPLASNLHELKTQVEGISSYVLEAYLQAKAPKNPRDRRDFGDVLFTDSKVQRYAIPMVMTFVRQLAWFGASQRSVMVDREARLRGVSSDSIARLQIQHKWISDQVEKLGGLSRVLFSYLPQAHDEEDLQSGAVQSIGQVTAARLQAQLAHIVQNGFVGADGAHHQLTEREAQHIMNAGQRFAASIERMYLPYVLYVLTLIRADLEAQVAGGYVPPEGLTEEIEARVTNLVAKLVLDDDSERVVSGRVVMGEGMAPNVIAPMRRYPFGLRMLGALTLRSAVGASPDWGLEGRFQIARALKVELEANLGRPIMKLDPTEISGPLRQWFMQEAAIFNQLLKGGPGCEKLLEKKKSRSSERDNDDDDDDDEGSEGGLGRRSGRRR